jgi:hypothetical protein
MKVNCPRGPTFFNKKKKGLNYIFKRHRHAKEYQQCLRPGAEMPGTRIWKINTDELSRVAFPPSLSLCKGGKVNIPAGGKDKPAGWKCTFLVLQFAARMANPNQTTFTRAFHGSPFPRDKVLFSFLDYRASRTIFLLASVKP